MFLLSEREVYHVSCVCMKRKCNKKLYLELIRAVSMLLVIFNHTGIRGFMLFGVATNSVLYPFYLFLSVACKPAVPLYWMVSGALLLPKDESLGQIYRHRVLRMVIVLLVFSAFYYSCQIWAGGAELDIAYFFTKLYSSQFATAYWFIYSYIGMLMMLPLLRKMVKSMNHQDFKYMFFLILMIRGIVPILQYLFGQGSFNMNTNLTANLFSMNVVYFVSGYYLDVVIEEKEMTLKNTLGLNVAGFIAIIITCLITQYKINVTGCLKESDVQTFYNNLVWLPTCALFYSARYILSKHHPARWLESIILMCGSTAFGIMLLEKILREQLVFIYNILFPMLHSLPACIIWVLAVYLCGMVITLCLQQIPGLKKLI